MDLTEVKVDSDNLRGVAEEEKKIVLACLISEIVKKALYFDQEKYNNIYRPILRKVSVLVILGFVAVVGLFGGVTFAVCYFIVQNSNLSKILPGFMCFFALMIIIYKRYNIINNFKILYLNHILNGELSHIKTQREYVKAVINNPEDANHWRWIKLQIYELRIEIVDGWLLSREDKDERYSFSIKRTQFRSWGSTESTLISHLGEEYEILSEKVDPNIEVHKDIIETILLEMLPKFNIGREKYDEDTHIEREDTEYKKFLCA